MNSRTSLIQYAEENGIEVPSNKKTGTCRLGLSIVVFQDFHVLLLETKIKKKKKGSDGTVCVDTDGVLPSFLSFFLSFFPLSFSFCLFSR